MALSLTQAAKEAKISKSTLSIAIRNGRVSAVHRPDGSYQIEPAELFRVFPPKAGTTEVTTPFVSAPVPPAEPAPNPSEPVGANPALLQKELEKVEALLQREREANQEERQRVADLQRRLDEANEERRLAEERSHTLMLRLMPPTPPAAERPLETSVVAPVVMEPPKTTKGFLSRLLGR